MHNCSHSEVQCLNGYELVRKYRCRSCGGVMMCKCEEDFARRYLPHQIQRASVEGGGFQRIPVTLGFVEGVCNSCRGKPEQAYPKSERPGRTSKIKRYYWREIEFRVIPRFAEWCESNGQPDWLAALKNNRDVHGEFEREAVEEVKKLQQERPKYIYDEEPQSAILAGHCVEVVHLRPKRTQSGVGATFEVDGLCLGSAVEVAQHHFRPEGYSSVLTESRPFHVLFGTFMWPVVQDPTDPKLRRVGGALKSPSGEQQNRALVWRLHPLDFGTAAYGERRAGAIERLLQGLRQRPSALGDVFEAWLGPSFPLRSYLSAHGESDVLTAKTLLSILPGDAVVTILAYLSKNYWHRYCGWPDLVFYRGDEFFFCEVKFSGDSLKEEQKEWIRGNSSELRLPYKLVKVHRMPLA